VSGGEWWNDTSSSNAAGDYDPAQTAVAGQQLDPNTVYSPPGTAAPIDQYNYVPDPNAPGGYQTFAPGQIAPLQAAAFSNTSGQYPNDGDMANAMANGLDLYPTVNADGAANLGGYNQLPQSEQQTWQDVYGASLAPYAWGQQTGNYNVPAAMQGFNNLPLSEQNIWYGTYGEYAPAVWAQQSAAAQQGQGSQLGNIMAQNPYLGNYPANQGGGTVAPGTWNPAGDGRGQGWGSIGAGTGGIQYGWGVPYFGGPQQQILPSNLPGLGDPSLAPGYIPGSGTYNQFDLSKGNLFGPIGPNGVLSNLNYGVGGPGDPTTGLEPQTPQEWVQGGKLFNWQGNMGQGPLAGLDYIATLFGRSDTPSGIGTPAWDAPRQYWDGLGQAVAQGKVQPTNRGWAALLAKGYTPQQLGGQAIQQAASVGVQANGQGASGAAGGGSNGPMGPGTQAFNYQAAYLDYLTARMNALEIPGMENQNQQFIDQLAFEQAKQKWLQEYQQQTLNEGQRQFNELQGLRQGELTGTYNGQQTLASRAEQNQTSLGYLNLLGQLRGPGDIFQYLKVLQGTPGGIRDIVNAASGAYRMPTTGGGAPTVGGYSNPADLNSLLSQMNDPNFGQEAQNLNLPAPNQINALALQRMSPSQQQALLGAYEAAGYNPNDVLAIFRNSLPQYAGSSGAAGRVNLFGR
jgi:hypothetical protein